MGQRPAVSRRRTGSLALAALLAATVSSCALPGAGMQLSAAHGSRVVSFSATGAPGSRYEVPSPGPLRRPPVSADLLVMSSRPLSARFERAVSAQDGVRATASLSLASLPVDGRAVTVGAVDPASYRRFTPRRTARATAVWDRLALGDLVLSGETAQALHQRLGGTMTLGNLDGSLRLRVGAFASMAPGIAAVVNARRGHELGLPPRNALLVSVGRADPATVASRIRRAGGHAVHTQLLAGASSGAGSASAGGSQGAGGAAGDVQRTAFLTGGSVARAVGSFTYRYFSDGTVAPDPAWVAANIRTEDMPILGPVTGHRVMLPQLRGALREIVRSGLVSKIDPSDFGGCYSPRFIDHDPAEGLSLHTWGIACDLNVSTNERGTAGSIDPRVVAIFQRWGFAWGGDWDYTDPMHFELAALVRPR